MMQQQTELYGYKALQLADLAQVQNLHFLITMIMISADNTMNYEHLNMILLLLHILF